MCLEKENRKCCLVNETEKIKYTTNLNFIIG